MLPHPVFYKLLPIGYIRNRRIALLHVSVKTPSTAGRPRWWKPAGINL